VTLYHYTCDHGRRLLGDNGKLLTPLDLGADPEGLLPRERPLLGLIWLTDLDHPNAAALGLTKRRLICDRTVHRYRVTGGGPVRWLTVRRGFSDWFRDGLESAAGALPAHWWVSQTPVPVVYDPLRLAPTPVGVS
jgi:hypothetical protein